MEAHIIDRIIRLEDYEVYIQRIRQDTLQAFGDSWRVQLTTEGSCKRICDHLGPHGGCFEYGCTGSLECWVKTSYLEPTYNINCAKTNCYGSWGSCQNYCYNHDPCVDGLKEMQDQEDLAKVNIFGILDAMEGLIATTKYILSTKKIL